ncbi:MAG: DUF1640 domain-containing protein [Rhodospirillales bacterium]|nr:DUF1640 domain-containing protein [Rhodospirillales bacterium]
MMAAFDTHAAVKRLRQAGFTEGQAEALSETLQDSVTGGDLATKADLANLATKAELAEVKNELKTEMAEVKTQLAGLATKAELVEVKNDLVWIKRIGALVVALLAVPILRDLLG